MKPESWLQQVEDYRLGPSLAEMERRSLEKKGIAGPTFAHVIEEVHSPWNLAYLTFTTGTSAFQNPVGVTYEELPARKAASARAVKQAGISAGATVLVTYPPLVNVFGMHFFQEAGIRVQFLPRSSRDAFLAMLWEVRPEAVLGESRFLRNSLEMAEILGMEEQIRPDTIWLAAGSPLDLELQERLRRFPGAALHDLYGCQEFGWLAVDGVPLREDLLLVEKEGLLYPVVGGLPVGDGFPPSAQGHCLNPAGPLVTYRAVRGQTQWETILYETKARDRATAERAAKTILRLKGRIVHVSRNLVTGSDRTVAGVRRFFEEQPEPAVLCGAKTGFLEEMLEAQKHYQSRAKNDPLWQKEERYAET